MLPAASAPPGARYTHQNAGVQSHQCAEGVTQRVPVPRTTSQASHERSAPPPGTPTAPACYVSFFQVSQALPATSAPPGARYTYHTQGAEPSERVSVRPPCTCDSYYLTGKQGAVYVVPSPPQVPTRAMYPFFKFRSGLGKDPQQKSSKKP